MAYGVDSGWPKEPCVKWGPVPRPVYGGGNFGGKSKSRKEKSFGRRYCVMWRTSKQMRHVSSEESTCVRESYARMFLYSTRRQSVAGSSSSSSRNKSRGVRTVVICYDKAIIAVSVATWEARLVPRCVVVILHLQRTRARQWVVRSGGGSGHPDRLTRSTKIRVLSLAVGLTSQHCALSFFLHFTSALQNCLLACLCLLTHLFSYALKESACCRICSSFVVVSTEIFINPGCFQCDLK